MTGGHAGSSAGVWIEVCVDSAAAAATAARAGADRIELCCALIVGGLTPSIGTVAAAVGGESAIATQVLIRPREGDFVYDAGEIRTMLGDIAAVRRETAGASVDVGFVIGALTPAGEIDAPTTADLVAACGDAPVTFHRAFDLTGHLDRSLDALVDIGVDRILTGGGVQRARDGASTLARLIERAGETIVVMPGGSIRPGGAAALVAATGAREIHFRAPLPRANHPAPRSETVHMSSARPPDESVRDETSAETIRAMVAALRETTPNR